MFLNFSEKSPFVYTICTDIVMNTLPTMSDAIYQSLYLKPIQTHASVIPCIS